MRVSQLGALAIAVAGALPVQAQDAAAVGQPYVVEGPGRAACSTYVDQDPAGDARRLTAAWLTGYLTAHHRLIPDVFDLSAWQSPAVLLSLLTQYCAANPDQIVEKGAQELVGYLLPRALTEPAEVIAFETPEGQGVLIYVPVVAQLRTALTEAGHPSGPDVPDIIAALRAYQEASGLDSTGLPDQPTLARLLQ